MSLSVNNPRSRPTAPTPRRPHDPRLRHTFWIDDRIVDDFVPVMRRYPFGSAALAVYAALARRADRDGVCWPSLALIARESGTSRSTVKRALRLLELLGLVDIVTCLDRTTRRQTSNRYTLLPPPTRLPQLDPDPGRWPPPQRRSLLGRGDQLEHAAPRSPECGKDELAPSSVCPTEGGGDRQPDWIPGHPDRGEGFSLNRGGDHAEPGEGFSRNHQEGNTHEQHTVKDNAPLFAITEIGLSNRQVWAAALEELALRADVSRAEIETWLRPAALSGQEGDTLLISAPNRVAADRISRRLLPSLRQALATTVGVPLDVRVITAPDSREAT